MRFTYAVHGSAHFTSHLAPYTVTLIPYHLFLNAVVMTELHAEGRSSLGYGTNRGGIAEGL
jgi:hypothetical protein